MGRADTLIKLNDLSCNWSNSMVNNFRAMIDDRSIDLRLKQKTFESSDNYLAVEVYRNRIYYL